MVKQTGNLSVPLHLRNAPTQLMKNHGYGKGYKYAHDFSGNFVQQEFMPEQLENEVFYDPGDNPVEKKSLNLLRQKWEKYYNK